VNRFGHVMIAGAVVACDASVTVGYNGAGGQVSPESCPDDALFRACSTEACVAAELTAAQSGKETLAVDADDIYFITEPDTLSKMPKSGGTVVPLTTVSAQLERITLDEENVYWTEFDGNILRIPKAGGPASTVTKIFGHPVSIASHQDDLYVVMTDSGEVAKITKSSGAETRLTGESGPIDLALDGEHVYWINQGEPGGATGELVRAPLGKLTSAEVILSNLEEPLALGVTADSIVWATYDKVFRLARAGGEPQAFDVPFGEPKGVTELDGILYAAGMYGLYRVRVSDGDTLALDPRGFTGITLGCDGLYAVGWFEPVLIRYGR
jgi:hypothetical protein